MPKEVLEHGNITTFQDAKQHNYIIRVLDEDDIEEVLNLQNYVLGKMEQRSACVPLTREEHLSIIGGRGEAIGLFIEKKLLATCAMLFPGSHEMNMAQELNFNGQELQLVAQLELALVHPELRGHKLQQKLAGMLDWRAEKVWQCRYLFTTVSPYNYPSIQTVTAMGMRIAKLCKMYYDWDRYVVYKDFAQPVKLDSNHIIHVPNRLVDKQQSLLNNGYLGFSQFKSGKDVIISFAKKISDQEK